MSVFEWGSGETAGGAFETWEMPGESEQYEEEQYEDEQYEQQESGQLESEAALETELAYELLSVSTEAELEEFLGKLVKGVGKFMKSGVGKAIGGVLRGVAKTALPMVGSALGSLVLPGVGTAIGGQLGSMASKLLEAEEAEMLGEQAELEAALRYVRWARSTARNASYAPRSVPPWLVARSAAVTAARHHAPALLRTRPETTAPWRGRRSGGYGATARWSGTPGARPAPRRRRPRHRGGWAPQPVSGYWGPSWDTGSSPGPDNGSAGDGDWGPWDHGDWSGGQADPYAGSGYAASENV